MNDQTSRDVARFVLGLASKEEAAELQSRASSDSELNARIAILQQLSGAAATPVSASVTLPAPPQVRRKGRSIPRIAAAVAAFLLLGGGLTWAGLRIFIAPPLFADNFDADWVDNSHWATPRKGVFFSGGHARLFDRGYLATRREFSEPIDIRFRWKWIDLAGDILYRDELVVALNTYGVPSDVYPFDNSDGVLIRLNATGGKIMIAPGGKRNEEYGHTSDGSQPFAADHWYVVRITDDGENIAVYVHEEGREPGRDQQPVLRAKVTGRGPRNCIALYNRERVAAASHESWIDDFEVRRLDKR